MFVEPSSQVPGVLSNSSSVYSVSSQASSSVQRQVPEAETDIFEPSKHFYAHFTQEAQQLEKPGRLLRIIVRIFGKKPVRHVSNMLTYFGIRTPLKAWRDYPVLGPQTPIYRSDKQQLSLDGQPMTVDLFAKRYMPKLFSTHMERVSPSRYAPQEIRYEVLPPMEGRDTYSIVYYVGLRCSRQPFQWMDRIYEGFMKILYGSSLQWRALQVDVNKDTGLPTQLRYETNNYDQTESSYRVKKSLDLNIPVVVTGAGDKWNHKVIQKSGRDCSQELDGILSPQGRIEMAFTGWNGNWDLTQMVTKRGYHLEARQDDEKNLWSLGDCALEFLDLDTFQREGFDAQETWLTQQKKTYCKVQMPPRDSHQAPVRIGFIGPLTPVIDGQAVFS